MTAFLILIILGLLGVIVWQFSKIFQLSRTKPSEAPAGVQDNRDNRIQGIISLVFGILFFGFMIHNFWFYSSFYPPKAASSEGVQIDNLFFTTMVILIIVQFIMQALLYYFSYKYHGREGVVAKFFPEHERLEFFWTIVPVFVLAGLIIYGLFTWSDIMNVNEDDEDLMIVELYAYQFGWKVRYAGEDNTLGKANVRYIEGVNALGVDESDPYSEDDVVAQEMYLPKGKKVLFKMRSQDVIHSAYFPHHRAQMNVLPGMITEYAFTPTITTAEMRQRPYMLKKVQKINQIRKDNSVKLVAKGEEALEDYEFDYFLLCNKVCGTSHYNMQMKIVVVEEDEFNDWISDQKTFAETMSKN